VGLKQIYFNLKTLDSNPPGNEYSFDGTSILIGDGSRVLAVLSEEKGIMELNFDRSCPYTQKIALVRAIRRATAGETLIIGPDITVVQVSLHIDSRKLE
jgi:hypothetical protein